MVDFGSLGRVLATRVITGLDELLTYERDASLEQGKPNAVVFPLTADDVVKIVRWAGEREVPLVARGAGTGISGGGGCRTRWDYHRVLTDGPRARV